MEKLKMVELSQAELCMVEGGKAKFTFNWNAKYDRNGFSGSIGGTITF